MSVHHRRLASLLLAAASITLVACADSPTAPAPIRSTNRSASIEGDTLQCFYGWTVMNGRYVCNAQ